MNIRMKIRISTFDNAMFRKATSFFENYIPFYFISNELKTEISICYRYLAIPRNETL